MNESMNRKLSIACLKREWQRINKFMSENGSTLAKYPVSLAVSQYLLSEDGKLELIEDSKIGDVAFKLYI